jgi:isoleucyl-tRNA synthetase
MLFIVSQVTLRLEPGEAADLEIEVARAEGEKCARCWRIVASVSTSGDMEGLCARCVEAIAATTGPVAG